MHNAEVHHTALHFNEMPSCTEAVLLLVIWCSPVHFRAVPVVEVVVLVGFSHCVVLVVVVRLRGAQCKMQLTQNARILTLHRELMKTF